MARFSDTLTDLLGNALPDYTVRVKNYPALTLATISATDGGAAISGSTVQSDSEGYYYFYADPGQYTIEVLVDGVVRKTLSDVRIAADTGDFITEAEAQVIADAAEDAAVATAAADATTKIGQITGIATSGSPVVIGSTAPAAGQTLVASGAAAAAWVHPVKELGFACSDETTALTTGTAKITLRVPFAFVITAVRASLSTAQTGGSIFTVDINETGTGTILSTKLTIDNGEKTSTTAATPAVVSDTSLADDAEITVDIDQVGDGTAKGLKIWLIGHSP